MISTLIQKWSGVDEASQIVVVTDREQLPLALRLQEEGAFPVQIEQFSPDVPAAFAGLGENDLLIAAFSTDTFLSGANRIFSPFSKPDGLAAKYIFLRLGISLESLEQGLSTDRQRMRGKLNEMSWFPDGAAVRVRNAAGTDISFRIHPFTTCAHEIDGPGGMAFLPPSETSAEVIGATGSGRIVIDVTVGQLYRYGELIECFGLADEPVTLIVENGRIGEVLGGDLAARVRKALFALPPEARLLVELGQGLSDMQPTGMIGVDESILSTCHFGFGDGMTCGVHWDVVISQPTIEPAE